MRCTYRNVKNTTVLKWKQWALWRITLIYYFQIKKKNAKMPLILLNLEQSIDGKWIKEQNLDSLETLKNCGFKVRAITSDKHCVITCF